MNKKPLDGTLVFLKVVIWIPAVIFCLVIIVLAGCELNKAYWDFRVSQMCEDEGGIKIYRHVELTAEEFEQLPRVGKNLQHIAILSKRNAIKTEDAIYADAKDTLIKKSFPKIYRRDITYIGIETSEKIAERVIYSRIGSDFPINLGPPSSFTCPSSEQFNKETDQIFLVKE